MRNTIDKQLTSCYAKYGRYASAHEAMAVLFEEVDELWHEVKQKQLDFNKVGSEIIDCIVVLEKMYNDIVKDRNSR